MQRDTPVTRRYLRTLDPAAIRPLPVLQLALQHVVDRYSEDGEYSAACEQLKTIRQDIVAGRVDDVDFSRHVYETHARLALAAHDLPELRACLGMLKQLYAHGQGGELLAVGVLLALLAHGTHKDVLALELRDVARRGLLGDAHVMQALAVCRAVLAGDYTLRFDDGAPLARALREHMLQYTCRVILAGFRVYGLGFRV